MKNIFIIIYEVKKQTLQLLLFKNMLITDICTHAENTFKQGKKISLVIFYLII